MASAVRTASEHMSVFRVKSFPQQKDYIAHIRGGDICAIYRKLDIIPPEYCPIANCRASWGRYKDIETHPKSHWHLNEEEKQYIPIDNDEDVTINRKSSNKMVFLKKCVYVEW